MELEDRITISTAEGIELQMQLAGLGSRFIAGSVDLALQLVAIGLVALASGGLIGGGLAVALLSVAAFALLYGYHVLFEVWAGGRTPGKRLTHLRVVRDRGEAVDLRASAVRNLARLIDGLPLGYLPTLLAIVLTAHNQRPGDLAAGTLVIRDAAPGPSRPAPSAAVRPGAAGVPATTAGWDVSGVSASELAAVRRFLERRTDLDPRARLALAARLEQGLRAKVAGAPPTRDPERFLEALAEVKTRR